MRNALKILIAACAAMGLAGCHKQPQPAANQDIEIEDNLAAGQIPPNAEIETLPPDESSETSSGELAKGEDNPDVNDLNSSSRSH